MTIRQFAKYSGTPEDDIPENDIPAEGGQPIFLTAEDFLKKFRGKAKKAPNRGKTPRSDAYRLYSAAVKNGWCPVYVAKRDLLALTGEKAEFEYGGWDASSWKSKKAMERLLRVRAAAAKNAGPSSEWDAATRDILANFKMCNGLA